MGRCAVCGEYYPPQFVNETKDKKAKKCVFCERGTNTIESVHPETFHVTTITKTETINAYKEYIDKLKAKNNISKFLVYGDEDE